MILCVSQTNVVTTVYDIFHLYISYHSSSSIYVDLIAPVANVICYYTTSTINKYFLSYLILSYKNTTRGTKLLPIYDHIVIQ